MRLTQHPELLDRLAAAYALGTLRGGARRRFEQLAREHAQVRAAALLWQGRWSAMAEVQTEVRPDAAVWVRIQQRLQAERAGSAVQPPVPRPSRLLAWWRSAALTGALATLAALGVGLWSQQRSAGQMAELRQQVQQAEAALQASAQIDYVSILADSKAGPSMLVTFDAHKQQLNLQRLGKFRESQQYSLQLWALPAQGGPRSLGVLDRGRLVQLPAETLQVEAIPRLAVSLEPRGGVTSGPTGPVLFSGPLIRREL